MNEQTKIKLLACESEPIWLRDPAAAGYAYLRESWYPMGPRNRLNKYTCFAWGEVIGYMQPDMDILQKFDKERRVRVFWLFHRYRSVLDGHDPFRLCEHSSAPISPSLIAPGRPSVPPPPAAYIVKAAQRTEALKHAAEMHDYWSRWARGNGPDELKKSLAAEAAQPKKGFLGWLTGSK